LMPFTLSDILPAPAECQTGKKCPVRHDQPGFDERRRVQEQGRPMPPEEMAEARAFANKLRDSLPPRLM
jgi:hypothetical protein